MMLHQPLTHDCTNHSPLDNPKIENVDESEAAASSSVSIGSLKASTFSGLFLFAIITMFLKNKS